MKHKDMVDANNETTKDSITSIADIFSEGSGYAVLDGGLATELERRGADINDPLWSAKCLLEDDLSDLIREVHLDYFRAGADVGISASYQATLQGFAAHGIEASKAENLLRKSVLLTCEARDQFWKEFTFHKKQGNEAVNGNRVRQKPLVAASIGSYGAYLADGSEYSGDYGLKVTVDVLKEFHRRRLQVLAKSGADFLAIETIPSLLEVQAFVELLEEEQPPIPSLISCNSKDGVNVVRGDLFEDCIALAASSKHVSAVGINCTPPRYVHRLIDASAKVTNKAIIVYPNTGEAWDGEKKQWLESTGVEDTDFVSYAPEWRKAGARMIGGCCRTTPNTIKAIRDGLHDLL